jgi:hypothetical protein
MPSFAQAKHRIVAMADMNRSSSTSRVLPTIPRDFITCRAFEMLYASVRID